MKKTTIFLSHITEEKELANIFKQQIEKTFLGMVEVFVSSDSDTIKIGQNWLDRITEGLRSCAAMILLCSPNSISRPWINFEAGAGWARDIPIAPLCHSGLRPVDLPLPISLLQGIEANDPLQVTQIFELIARQLGSQVPSIDANSLVQSVLTFEAPYIIRLRLGKMAHELIAIGAFLVQEIIIHEPNQVIAVSNVYERDFIPIKTVLDQLQNESAIQYSFKATQFTLGDSGGGTAGTITISCNNNLHELLKNLISH
ncbi:toll/interleukin-1 receptor domain-containing protein [Pseudochrobactrum kiredjianiae]|uniref:Toll/interleukin-1 receptor domain-containing protein n=1 Tax=Pseudochrobactrum kiredjianiae TaxID=386305 RepID=A0ABW3V7S2_9HYPH|nr:toll/interleukin-1 receptor domain-containing protein [Pseudochrobactrum kiredjianiae]MDM7850163.1 toll/interleukin-1 receptor domain-containing protein [Pseudochrobactrum kiredjianiae]